MGFVPKNNRIMNITVAPKYTEEGKKRISCPGTGVSLHAHLVVACLQEATKHTEPSRRWVSREGGLRSCHLGIRRAGSIYEGLPFDQHKGICVKWIFHCEGNPSHTIELPQRSTALHTMRKAMAHHTAKQATYCFDQGYAIAY